MKKPIRFSASLAEKVGVKGAIVLSVLKDKMASTNNNATDDDICVFNERIWVKCSVKSLQKTLTFFSEKQIRFALEKLKKDGYILAEKINKKAYDMTNWYTVVNSKLSI